MGTFINTTVATLLFFGLLRRVLSALDGLLERKMRQLSLSLSPKPIGSKVVCLKSWEKPERDLFSGRSPYSVQKSTRYQIH